MRFLLLVAVLCAATPRSAFAQLPRLAINDNRTPAGVLRNGVLELKLEVTTGMWHPDAEDGAGTDVMAIGVAGKPATVPSPLIRVPRGTLVRTTVHNQLDESVMVFGLHHSHALADSVRLQPGETRVLEVRAAAAGNYAYGAWRRFRVPTPENPDVGNDMPAAGAFVVDEPGARGQDRILVINMMADTMRLPKQLPLTSILATINGKSWPHNERYTHDAGDTIIWRVINASLIPHPMHLHGFYYDVLSRSVGGVDTIYAARDVRKVVTERLMPLTSMTMRWVPERAGNWLFHCHLTAHTQLHAPIGGTLKASATTAHVHDAMHGMSNLLVGITVRGTVAADPDDRRQHRLVVEQHDPPSGELRRFSYSLDGATNTGGYGPLIVLHKNQPTSITVVNRAREATAVHWHGIELESFSDGVAGFGGHGSRISPLVAPGDSFVARMTPPRAGTFIYHTHVDELRQQRGGLYGPLLVVDPGSYDPAAERIVVLGSGELADVVFNGEAHPDLQLEVGKTYRLRLIHIMVTRPAMYVALLDPSGAMGEWQLVAKDGADLPAHQIVRTAARQNMSNGETYDVVFTPKVAGIWRLEARAVNGTVFGHMTLTAR